MLVALSSSAWPGGCRAVGAADWRLPWLFAGVAGAAGRWPAAAERRRGGLGRLLLVALRLPLALVGLRLWGRCRGGGRSRRGRRPRGTRSAARAAARAAGSAAELGCGSRRRRRRAKWRRRGCGSGPGAHRARTARRPGRRRRRLRCGLSSRASPCFRRTAGSGRSGSRGGCCGGRRAVRNDDDRGRRREARRGDAGDRGAAVHEQRRQCEQRDERGQQPRRGERDAIRPAVAHRVERSGERDERGARMTDERGCPRGAAPLPRRCAGRGEQDGPAEVVERERRFAPRARSPRSSGPGRRAEDGALRHPLPARPPKEASQPRRRRARRAPRRRSPPARARTRAPDGVRRQRRSSPEGKRPAQRARLCRRRVPRRSRRGVPP